MPPSTDGVNGNSNEMAAAIEEASKSLGRVNEPSKAEGALDQIGTAHPSHTCHEDSLN